jgi:hypothetical protein
MAIARPVYRVTQITKARRRVADREVHETAHSENTTVVLNATAAGTTNRRGSALTPET